MRDHAEYLQVAYGSSERRVCQVLNLGRFNLQVRKRGR